ncbi:ectoine/hydroxyectoine ABC transporter substrate-binding protein EhuB [Pseudomonas fluorescens]|uniref:Ectoine/hydroxyectoine ABC transporter substrate-binding protein EhuB n=1 Tax=Pseudomonas fluorescens TaxID=294 RepID=A0A327NC20_PSEFL|nr:ectoine/hydroxyectoine ABC transporter substrate-binding protein EhuB [Pseudomonas fluorescens]RAI72475.1 ectoine/hydroxyectoine ABC transporter substrate-binding protein EhuB [Pseudomonas fluorescens]
MIMKSFQSSKVSTALALKAVITGCIALSIGTQASAAEFDVTKALRIGIANEPPVTELKADGSLSGAGPDVDRAALEQSGFTKFEAQVMPYGAMIPALQAGRVELVSAGGLNITPERCKQVIYSEPVICGEQGLLVRADSENVASYKDVVAKSLRIGVAAGGTQSKDAVAAGVPQENILVYPDGPSAIKMLQNKRIDAIPLYTYALEDLKKRSGDESLKVIPMVGMPMDCAAASFKKSDVALRDAYNTGLAKLKASGEFVKIMAKYGMEGQAQTALRAKPTAETCVQK